MTYALSAVFMLVSLLMIMIVLLQKGRGGGISAAFSGGGGGTAFGTKTGDVFTTATVVLFAIFLLMAIGLNYRFMNEKNYGPGGSEVTPTTSPADMPTGPGADLLPPAPSSIPPTTPPTAPPTMPPATLPK